jgi:4-amino-4-deoxy-L-arabinose transferase-like glycosyltransferase
MNLPVSREHFSIPRIAWWILITGALLRILFYYLSDNDGTDALERAALAAKWINHPNWDLVFGGSWLPLHFWLVGGLALVIGNVELASRLLSLLTSVASLWLVWKIARNMYSRCAADFSLLAFAFYTLHIGYSTTSSSEAPYLFFVLAGLYFFLIFGRSSGLFWLALSGICLTLASAIRYEAWVVIFGVGLIVLGPPWRILRITFWRVEHLKSLALFVLTAGSWPGFWMGYSWLKWKHPLYFVALNHKNVAGTLALVQTGLPAIYRFAVFPASLFLALSPLVLGAASYALWVALHKTAGWQIAFLLITLALVQYYQIASGGVMAFARYTITIGTFLAIMSGDGFERIRRRYFPDATRTFYAAIIIVLALNMGIILTLSEAQWRFSEKFAAISPRVRFPHYIQGLGKALHDRLGPADSLVIDNYNEQPNEVEAAAGLPLLNSDRVFDSAAEEPQNLRGDLLRFIDTKGPRYLVYSDRGTLRLILGLLGGCQSRPIITEGMEFQCLFATDVYTLYEIHYLSSRTSVLAKVHSNP